MYESIYYQRLREPDQKKWQHKIIPWREVIGIECSPSHRLRLKLKNPSNGEISFSDSSFDIAILGTGYVRNGHETLLQPTRHLLLGDKYAVERSYRVSFREGVVAHDSGIWLQGCCEASHGVGGAPPAFPKMSDWLTVHYRS